LALAGLVWAGLAGGGSVAQAASPVLSNLEPRGGQRGTEIEVTLSGDRMADAQEILFYETGIEVTKLEVVNPQNVKVMFKVAPDAVLGSHRFRVRTATGVSELRPFFVGALPVVAEVEPNSDFAAPQAIAINTTVHGTVDNEDVDYFVVEAKKGDRITAEIEAIRLGISLFDAYVSIMNAARFELSTSDDNALVWQDGVASIVAPEDGKYIVQVRDSAYGGNGACRYRVHVGSFPRPVALVPAGGRIGEPTNVKFIGDVLGDRDQTIPLPGAEQSGFLVFAQDDKGIAPSGQRFRLSEFPNVIEAEPNETHDNATKFAAPMALNGVIQTPGDADFFRFTAKKGEVYDIRVHARGLRSPLDPILHVFVAGGGALAGNDDSAGPDSYLRFAVPNDGDYLVRVIDHLGNGGPAYFYRVELTPVKPQLSLTINEFQQYVQPTVAVPKGNRVGLVLSAQRVDFGGPLTLTGVDLPAGVTLETPGVPANSAVVPVIFSATPEAATSGKLAEVVAALTDPNQPNLKVEGKVQQNIALVRGQNNIPFWTEYTSKVPVVVTDEAPFTLSIVEPKVPLVRGGQMNLKVVAVRKEGFKAPIKVDMLWLPPGIGASGSIAIAEGATEAQIPMNAAGNAELNTWRIAIRATSDAGAGPFDVCTPFANLRVAEPYLAFTYEQAAVEQGKETELVVKVEKKFDFPGVAKATLYGLPNKVTAPTLDVTKDTTELVFKITTDMTSPAGNHNNVFAQVIVTENEEPVTHNIGTAKLRVDVPLPPKKDMPPPAPMPAAAESPKPAEAPPAPPKRLTRLEQLRLEQQERDKKK
jgi:hypothetical protein